MSKTSKQEVLIMNSELPLFSLMIFPIVLVVSIIFLILIVKLANKAIRALDIYIQKNGAQQAYTPKEDKGYAIFNLDKLDRASGEEAEEEEEVESSVGPHEKHEKEERKYSTSLRKFHIVVGGIRSKDVERQSLEILGKFIPSEAVKMTEDGFIVEVPIQTIPAIIRSFTEKGISLYTVAPMDEGGQNQ